MVSEMANVAKECLRTPGRASVWSMRLNQYVCVDTPEGRAAVRERDRARPGTLVPPSLSKEFKLVFFTAASGTALFLVLCVAVTLLAGKEPPPLLDKVVMATMDLVKVGFGAIVGLLGGKVSTVRPSQDSS